MIRGNLDWGPERPSLRTQPWFHSSTMTTLLCRLQLELLTTVTVRGRERARDRREGKKSRRVDGKRDILISDLQYVSILADTGIHAEGLRNSLRSGWRVPLDIPRCKGCGLHLRQGQRLTGTWGHEDTHCASPLAGMYCVSKLYRHCDAWRYSGTPL